MMYFAKLWLESAEWFWTKILAVISNGNGHNTGIIHLSVMFAKVVWTSSVVLETKIFRDKERYPSFEQT
mgnify:CR=1 FL=1